MTTQRDFMLAGEVRARDFGAIAGPLQALGTVRYPNNLEVTGENFTFDVQPTSDDDVMHISGVIRGDEQTVIVAAQTIADALTAGDLPYELEIYPRGGAPIAVLTHPRWHD